MGTGNEKILSCPHCGQALERVGGSYICASRHTYDVARSGYVNLTSGSSRRESGDSGEMAEARAAFLDRGFYAPLRDAVCRIIGECGILVDAGCGEGYYTVAASQKASFALGVDLSRPSVERAAKRAKAVGVGEKTLFAVSSVYTLPLPDGCADVVLSMFAPCAEKEFSRILKRGGRLILAGAGKEHLWGMKKVLYRDVRENTVRADLPLRMKKTGEEELRYMLRLKDAETIRALYRMTPYAFRTPREAEERLFSLPKLDTLADFMLYTYVKE